MSVVLVDVMVELIVQEGTGTADSSTFSGATGVFGVGGRLGNPRKLGFDQNG